MVTFVPALIPKRSLGVKIPTGIRFIIGCGGVKPRIPPPSEFPPSSGFISSGRSPSCSTSSRIPTWEAFMIPPVWIYESSARITPKSWEHEENLQG